MHVLTNLLKRHLERNEERKVDTKHVCVCCCLFYYVTLNTVMCTSGLKKDKLPHWFPGLDLVLRGMSVALRGGCGALLVLVRATAAQATVPL